MLRNTDRSSRGRRSRRRIAVVGAVATVVTAGGGAALSTESGGIVRVAMAATVAAPSRGYSPQTMQRAYGVSPLLRRGVDGRGETVVLPETVPPGGAGGPSPIRQDLTAFDRRYHLPRVDLTLGRALGFTGDTSVGDSEEVQDVEIVHAIAPAAKITIMLIPQRAFTQPSELASLFRAAAGRGNIVSFSQSECESTSCLSAAQLRSLTSALRYARDRHVSIFASAGDSGAGVGNIRGAGERGVRAPASSPLVTGSAAQRSLRTGTARTGASQCGTTTSPPRPRRVHVSAQPAGVQRTVSRDPPTRTARR
jgi:subtilase family serine protease